MSKLNRNSDTSERFKRNINCSAETNTYIWEKTAKLFPKKGFEI